MIVKLIDGKYNKNPVIADIGTGDGIISKEVAYILNAS